MSNLFSTAERSDLHLVEPEDNEPALSTNLPAGSMAIEVSRAVLNYPVGPTRRASLKAGLLSIMSRKPALPKRATINALRDVSLRIALGERVALIGRNGSGKSTLLRALAGIYPLASGDIRIAGRVGTLLEIGLGFELESTGRENIYYRGMTLGYSRAQLAKIEKEIVEFAGLGEFIDLPMRTYSAGMCVRLGFAISTQFAPEILLVDEVFGAGDAEFSQRAIRRMRTIVANSGIFVLATHDLGLVKDVCTRAIWLHEGRIRMDGAPNAVVSAMLQETTT